MRIAVVGAGFSGLVFAYKLASKGYDVDLYEEHKRVGFPPHCTGLVSMDTVELIGGPARENILGTYNGVVLEVEGTRCTIDTVNRVVKLNREGLEEGLLEEAEANGASIYLGVRVSRINSQGLVQTGNDRRIYDLVILAEGIHGKLREQIGLDHRLTTTYGLNAEISGQDQSLLGDYILIGFERSLHGFSWKFGFDDRILVGALSKRAKEVKEKVASMVNGGRPRRFYGGIVIHGPPLKQLRLDKVVLVGDAAGLNKPLTGGGLYPNAWLSVKLSEIDLATGDFYEVDRVAGMLVRKLLRQYRIARAYYGDTSSGVVLLRSAVEAGLCDVLSGRIDYDGHERIISLVLSSPARGLRILFSTLRHSRREFYKFVLDFIEIKHDG